MAVYSDPTFWEMVVAALTGIAGYFIRLLQEKRRNKRGK